MIPEKIVSGGQTGVDRAALGGPVPERYPVEECGYADYGVRTELNVLRCDAPLVLNRGRPRTLNVAGPRESKFPGIQRASLEVLRLVLKG